MPDAVRTRRWDGCTAQCNCDRKIAHSVLGAHGNNPLEDIGPGASTPVGRPRGLSRRAQRPCPPRKNPRAPSIAVNQADASRYPVSRSDSLAMGCRSLTRSRVGLFDESCSRPHRGPGFLTHRAAGPSFSCPGRWPGGVDPIYRSTPRGGSSHHPATGLSRSSSSGCPARLERSRTRVGPASWPARCRSPRIDRGRPARC